MNSTFGAIWPKRSSTPVVPKSGEHDDHTAPIRPAQRMVDPEPLIVEYSLVNWGDTSTKPGDKIHLPIEAERTAELTGQRIHRDQPRMIEPMLRRVVGPEGTAGLTVDPTEERPGHHEHAAHATTMPPRATPRKRHRVVRRCLPE